MPSKLALAEYSLKLMHRRRLKKTVNPTLHATEMSVRARGKSTFPTPLLAVSVSVENLNADLIKHVKILTFS